ncbi:MAG TPA: hypothetical protein VHO69_19350 [Phototrophicaceae bacterium]|nr:hypothetical protein [Phototrophicaceae bacterium]
MQKQKREVLIARPNWNENRQASRTLAVILIGVGVMLLLMNAGVFSFHDIGSFFGNLGGSIGSFFGHLGGAMGSFFGNLGGSIGHIFGSLGSLIGRFWPVILILLGVLLLVRRKPATLES